MASTIPAPARRAGVALLVLSMAAMLAAPHVSRVRQASLYSDDVMRVVDLQARPIGELLFRPFNEHMAPFFEVVSWAAWRASGRDLTRAPLAFTLASYVPSLINLGLLARWIRRETGSTATALAGMALFGLGPPSAEAAYWYSASSFAWSLAWTLVVLIRTAPGEGGRGWARLLALFLGSALAPASSAIGLLAGPLATARMAAGRRDRLPSLVPLAGTLAYLAVASAFRYHVVLEVGLRRESDTLGGLILALRAPTSRLIPGCLGLHDVDLRLPSSVNLALSGLALVGILTAMAKARGRGRGAIVAGLGLIVGGYAATYPFRNIHGDRWLLQVERFHLFPQAGLAILAALAARQWLARFDRSPLTALAAANAVAAGLLAMNLGEFQERAKTYRSPEQRPTLAALVRLGEICRAQGVSKERCVAALDPVWAHWFQPSYNGLWLVPAPIGAVGPVDPGLRATLLGQLDAGERRALWGGMDASTLARPAEELAGPRPECLAVGRLVETDHAHCAEAPAGPGLRQYGMTGWPAYLEYELKPDDPRSAGVARYLELRCGPSAEPLEILWARPGERWSPSRSVRFRPDPDRGPRAWALPLDRIPHWDPSFSGRIRLRFVAGPIAVGEPRLLR